jgi:exodeoxyribonuclease VII large subunit
METGARFAKKDVYSVGELSRLISAVMQSELFCDIKVRGEIISKQVKNGNVYLSLIDSDAGDLPANKKAVLKVILFSWYDVYVKEEYKEGDEVIVSGDMSYYAPFGSLSLNAKSLCLYGEGMELVKLKRLEEKLTKEGLFAPERKRKLPEHVRKIAIITSASGAAYHDILETLAKKVPVSTVLFDAVVQGEGAPASLIRALDKAYKSDCDLLIFGRGGGSKTDLSCFNDEAVVRKLASSPIPVITGIGHEIDRSLCDLAADVYAITPTDAADKALPDLSLVQERIQEQQTRLLRAGMNNLAERELSLTNQAQTLEKYSPLNLIASFAGRLKGQEGNLKAVYLQLLSEKEMRIQAEAGRLEQAYPLAHLPSGMALIRRQGRAVSSVQDVQKDEEVELGLQDGILKARIE